MKLLIAVMAVLVSVEVSGETNQVPELPVEIFFRDRDVRSMRISPDGKFVASICNDHGKGLLFGINLETGERKAIISEDAHGFEWLTSERLLLRVGGKGAGGLFAINRDGSNPKMLQAPFVMQMHNFNFRLQLVWILSEPDTLIDTMLIARAEWNPSIKSELPHPEVRRINFFTGKSSLEEKNPGSVVHWILDSQGQVRGALAVEKEVQKVLHRKDKQHAWEVIHQSRVGHSEILPLTIQGENTLWVGARGGKDTMGIFTFDPDQKKLGQCLWQHNQFDLVGAMKETTDFHISAVAYEADRLRVEWFDERRKAIQAQVDEALPDAVNVLISQTKDGSKLLFQSFSDRSPSSYYLVDTNRNEFGIMGKMAGWVNPEQMAAMNPIEYNARDGLKIRGYLTLPPGGSSTNMPMIVYPHGGPRLRDHWGFDPCVQFLANRGYAVLQVNFRGSAGYGLAFLDAGNKQWGRKMQDDIVDGVQWAISQGIADRNRIGIFGASYGGYAALMGLISTPDLFRCGICYAGVTDLRSLLKHTLIRLPDELEVLEKERIGDYREEKGELDKVSPLRHVEAIKAPLLLAYGAKDPLVPIKQGRDLAKALRKAGKKYELIIEPDEGHGFANETNRFKLYRKIEHFLQTKLSARE